MLTEGGEGVCHSPEWAASAGVGAGRRGGAGRSVAPTFSSNRFDTSHRESHLLAWVPEGEGVVDDHRSSNRFGEAKIGTTHKAVNGCDGTSRNRPITRMKRGLIASEVLPRASLAARFLRTASMNRLGGRSVWVLLCTGRSR